jgi:hypothetical protein
LSGGDEGRTKGPSPRPTRDALLNGSGADAPAPERDLDPAPTLAAISPDVSALGPARDAASWVPMADTTPLVLGANLDDATATPK